MNPKQPITNLPKPPPRKVVGIRQCEFCKVTPGTIYLTDATKAAVVKLAVCPGCAKKLMPDLYAVLVGEEKQP